MYLWQGAPPREAAWLGFWFNVGTFAAGTYWLYISIHMMARRPSGSRSLLMVGARRDHGAVSRAARLRRRALAARQQGPLRWLVGVPAAWVFIEWWRGWFLSGFAWLSLGYSQTDTWLARLAPIVGVYGISALLLLSAGALVALMRIETRA